MKKTINTMLAILLGTMSATAQHSPNKPRIAAISVETSVNTLNVFALGSQVRVELEKLNRYQVVDWNEIRQMLDQTHLKVGECYSKTCLVEAGKLLSSEKVFSASIFGLDNRLAFNFRVIDVASGSIEKEYVREYLKIPDEVHNMIRLSVADMFGQPYDENLMMKLSKENDFDNLNNNPNKDRLALDGPRMGFVAFTGDLRERVMAPKSQGGMDCYPFMFQFGYQFEKQYLNEGKVQALFEFIPMITGLDQAKFIPGFSFLHGIRSNVSGWEFAFGPSINVLTLSNGYYNDNGRWTRQAEFEEANKDNPDAVAPEYIERLDYRGPITVRSTFVFAAGKTFKSGRLNIPVNVFVVPGKSGWRVGASFGFNSRNMK